MRCPSPRLAHVAPGIASWRAVGSELRQGEACCAGFLHQLPLGRMVQVLVLVHEATRKRPMSQERLAAALD